MVLLKLLWPALGAYLGRHGALYAGEERRTYLPVPPTPLAGWRVLPFHLRWMLLVLVQPWFLAFCSWKELCYLRTISDFHRLPWFPFLLVLRRLSNFKLNILDLVSCITAWTLPFGELDAGFTCWWRLVKRCQIAYSRRGHVLRTPRAGTPRTLTRAAFACRVTPDNTRRADDVAQ
jgi:hypothetical protein